MKKSHYEPTVKDLVTPGDVVQIAGTVDGFAGCFMVITEIKPKYAVGYATQPGRPDVPLFTRMKWENLAFVGKATWVLEEFLTGKLKDAAETARRQAERAASSVRTKMKAAGGK